MLRGKRFPQKSSMAATKVASAPTTAQADGGVSEEIKLNAKDKRCLHDMASAAWRDFQGDRWHRSIPRLLDAGALPDGIPVPSGAPPKLRDLAPWISLLLLHSPRANVTEAGLALWKAGRDAACHPRAAMQPIIQCEREILRALHYVACIAGRTGDLSLLRLCVDAPLGKPTPVHNHAALVRRLPWAMARQSTEVLVQAMVEVASTVVSDRHAGTVLQAPSRWAAALHALVETRRMPAVIAFMREAEAALGEECVHRMLYCPMQQGATGALHLLERAVMIADVSMVQAVFALPGTPSKHHRPAKCIQLAAESRSSFPAQSKRLVRFFVARLCEGGEAEVAAVELAAAFRRLLYNTSHAQMADFLEALQTHKGVVHVSESVPRIVQRACSRPNSSVARRGSWSATLPLLAAALALDLPLPVHTEPGRRFHIHGARNLIIMVAALFPPARAWLAQAGIAFPSPLTAPPRGWNPFTTWKAADGRSPVTLRELNAADICAAVTCSSMPARQGGGPPPALYGPATCVLLRLLHCTWGCHSEHGTTVASLVPAGTAPLPRALVGPAQPHGTAAAARTGAVLAQTAWLTRRRMLLLRHVLRG